MVRGETVGELRRRVRGHGGGAASPMTGAARGAPRRGRAGPGRAQRPPAALPPGGAAALSEAAAARPGFAFPMGLRRPRVLSLSAPPWRCCRRTGGGSGPRGRRHPRSAAAGSERLGPGGAAVAGPALPAGLHRAPATRPVPCVRPGREGWVLALRVERAAHPRGGHP